MSYYYKDYMHWTSKTRFYFTLNRQTRQISTSRTLVFFGLYKPSTKKQPQGTSAKSLPKFNKPTKPTITERSTGSG